MRSKETQNSYTPALTSGGGGGGGERKEGKQLKRGEKEGLTVLILVLNIRAIELPCSVTPL